jgi:twitching motility protein PilT
LNKRETLIAYMKSRDWTVTVPTIFSNILSCQELALPEGIAKLALLPRGLVVVTGSTGSGKSTTLAAIINEANRLRKDHIIAIEDNIEFVHKNMVVLSMTGK